MEEIKKLVSPYFVDGQTEVEITAVLKYIENTGYKAVVGLYYKDSAIYVLDVIDEDYGESYGSFPNKPIQLYNEQEKEDLLELLTNLK